MTGSDSSQKNGGTQLDKPLDEPIGQPIVTREGIVILAIAIIAFAGAFYFFGLSKAGEKTLNDIRVIGSSQPMQDISRIINQDKVLIEEQLVAGNSSKNSIVAIQAAQIANVFRSLRKQSATYGIVEGGEPVGCTAESNYCTGAQIVVRMGDCNCMRVENERVVVEATEEFYSQNNYANVLKITGIFGAALLQNSK